MNPADNESFNEAVAMAQAGRKAEASVLITQLLQRNPDNSDLLLWKAFTASNGGEARYCLERLALVDPSNPSLPAAWNWLKNLEAPQPPKQEAPPAAASSTASTAVAQPTNNYVSLCAPIADGSNFIMSQSGGSFLIAAIGFIGSSALIILFILIGAVFRINSIASIYNTIYLWVGMFVVFVVSGLYLLYSWKDVMGRPITARGQISNRTEKRHDHRDQYGRVTDYDTFYYVDFKPDDSQLGTAQLKLTEEQYKSSGLSSYAEVVYTRRLHYARKYQPLNLR